MATRRPYSLASFRKEHLFVEFASLKYACPEGLYVSLTPGNPTLWPGVLFVRDGPYAPAILRFQISFPPGYPESPPNVTFTTDIFHPLVTPLTTYTYTTGSSDTDPVSATDEERLPTGGFSLRHGFPFWFQRAKKSAANSACSSRNVSGSHAQNDQAQPQSATGLAEPGSATPATSRSLSASKSTPAGSPLPSPGQSTNDVTVAEVLQYVRSAFSDEVLLDSLPLEAAGNPGAWHAWRAHRRRTGHLPSVSAHGRGPDGTLPGSDSDATIASGQDTPTRNLTRKRLKAVPKQPGEWNWEGVWEERVRKGVEASQSEAVLYGNAGGRDELIRFLDIDENLYDKIKDDMRIVVKESDV